MTVRSINGEHELPTLVELAAALQQRPERHVIYLGDQADGILAELAEATWRDVSAVAVDGERPRGWLVGDVDHDMGRVWWLGPFVATDERDEWESIASRLLTAGRAQLGDGVDEEEMAVDARFEWCRSWAVSEGFSEDEGSAVLRLDDELAVRPTPTTVREIDDADHDVVARLHEGLFPGTHTTGRELVGGHDATHRRLVADVDGEVVGYVAVERQADGSGYIDYLGVRPSARRQGLGGVLVRAGVAELRRLDVTGIGLTVRADNETARGLYRSLGFDEERVAIPLRRGFSLG